MYGRQIANDFVVSAWTRITSADPGVKWYADENRAMVSWAGFQGGHIIYWYLTELSSVLFGGISWSFLPYSKRKDIAVNYFILSLLTRGLSHKRYLHLFCFGYEIQWLQSCSVPKSVLNKISQNRLHTWKSWKVLVF